MPNLKLNSNLFAEEVAGRREAQNFIGILQSPTLSNEFGRNAADDLGALDDRFG